MSIYLSTNNENDKEYYLKEDTGEFQQREIKPFNKNLVFISLIPIPFIENTKEKHVIGNIYIYILISILVGILIGFILTVFYKNTIQLKKIELNNDEIVQIILQGEEKLKKQVKIISVYSIFILLVLLISIVDKSIFSLISISFLTTIEIYLFNFFGIFKRKNTYDFLRDNYI